MRLGRGKVIVTYSILMLRIIVIPEQNPLTSLALPRLIQHALVNGGNTAPGSCDSLFLPFFLLVLVDRMVFIDLSGTQTIGNIILLLGRRFLRSLLGRDQLSSQQLIFFLDASSRAPMDDLLLSFFLRRWHVLEVK